MPLFMILYDTLWLFDTQYNTLYDTIILYVLLENLH